MTSRGSSFWKSGSVPLIEPEFLGSIIAAASDIALVISAEGVILSVLVNANDENFGNLAHWEGRPVTAFLTNESIEKFQGVHAAYVAGSEVTTPVELNHSDNAVWQYPVRYSFHRFGSENAVLMLGRDLRQIAETQQQLVQAQIALEQGYEARREFDSRYRAMLAHSDDAVVFVMVSTGRVDDANERAADMLGLKVDALQGADFAALFADRSGAELTESLITATLADEVQHIEVHSARTRSTLRLAPTLFRAGGQRILMCRLTSVDDAASDVAVSDPAAIKTAALYAACSDAMLFVRGDGEILSVNDAFLDLVGATHKSGMTGQNLAQFMLRGQIDIGLMLGEKDGQGGMRIYATRLLNKLGAKVSVEVSLTRLDIDGERVFGLIMRDVNRLEPVRASHPDAEGPSNSSQKVVELVGSASLKEIVAETTDVVEKLCIETAVTLTRNNRVAAAEMLGLSRQSLYVKLRKYGLLAKD
jgi:transcriptional regulator PpsR